MKVNIKQAINHFVDSREELLEHVEKTAWRKWLTSPDAWLQYMTSNYKSDEQKAITEFVMTYTGEDRGILSLKDTIKWVYTDPSKIAELKSISEMMKEHGPMIDDLV